MRIWSKISKIILLILCIGITSLLGRNIVNNLLTDLNDIEQWSKTSYLIMVIALSGLATILYHIQSILVLWRINKSLIRKRRIHDILWISAFIFGSSIISLMISMMLKGRVHLSSEDDFISESVFLAFILIGLWHIIEAIKTRKRYKRYLNHSKLNIDEIGQA